MSRKVATTAMMAAVLHSLFAGQAIAAPKAIVLKPATPWYMDWTPKTCTLYRGFGNPKRPDLLRIERVGPTTEFQLIMTSDQFRSFDHTTRLRLQYGQGTPIEEDRALPGKAKTGQSSIFISTTAVMPFEEGQVEMIAPGMAILREAATSSISALFNSRIVTFDTGKLDKPFAQMRKCTDDLVKTWGFDPEQQSRFVRRAEPANSPAKWLTSNDYPREMLAAGKQAIIKFRLNVDERGAPTSCDIQRAFGDPVFDKLSCQAMMRRARFLPALDENGRPAPSYFLSTIKFIMSL